MPDPHSVFNTLDGGDMGAGAKMAPSKESLVDILRTKRLALLEELRNVEQALEALESNPSFDQVFMRVNKILRRM